MEWCVLHQRIVVLSFDFEITILLFLFVMLIVCSNLVSQKHFFVQMGCQKFMILDLSWKHHGSC